MAAGKEFDQDDPDKFHQKLKQYISEEDGEFNNVENLKVSLKKGFRVAKNKSDFAFEKQDSLYKEQELSFFSVDGERNNSLPSNMTGSLLDSPVKKVTMTSPPQYIDTLREECTSAQLLNKTLMEKLSQVEQQRDRLVQSKEDLKLELDASFTARASALVDKIFTAQKEREESIKKRLKCLNDDKEELIKKIRELEKNSGFDSGVEANSLGDEVYMNANIMVQQLNNQLNEVQHEQNLFEIQHRKNEKNRLKALQNQLKGVINERDEATKKCQVLEEELEHFKLQLSLKNSLSNDNNLRKEFNLTLDEYKVKLKESEEEIVKAQTSYDKLHSKFKNIANERNVMAVQEQNAICKYKEEKHRADKLERLLLALRRRKER